MDEELARGLARLLAGSGSADSAGSGSGYESESDAVSAEDLADVLWVARFAGRGMLLDAEESEEPSDAALGAADPNSGREQGGYEPGAAPPPHVLPPNGPPHVPATQAVPPPAPDAPGIPLHPVSTAGRPEPAPDGAHSGAGPHFDAAVVRVHRETALSDSLAISRALRPLKRRVRAPGLHTLDEEATAQATGETSLLIPAWLPRTERLFSVDLVVDTGPSMAVWHQLSSELRTLLEGHGAFRMTRTWSLDSAEPVPRLSPFRRATHAGSQRTVPLEQLADPTGRRVLLLLTDGVGEQWRGPLLRAALEEWSRTRPLAVLQVLPSSLWHRTALVPVPVLARPAPPGRAAPVFRPQTPSRGANRASRRGGWVPVLELGADWIAPWARLVAGGTAGWTPLTALSVAPQDAPDEVPEELGGLEGLDAEALVERFRGEASLGAFELAGYLAAVPLVLPVMRLVQRVMMPRSTAAHLAEVFLSGLLGPSEDGAAPDEEDPDLRLYDFRPGVRQALLNTLTRRESRQVLDVVGQVSGKVAQRLGGSLNFRALIPSAEADAEGNWRLPEGSLPFARVTVAVLAGLGGRYEAAAAALAERIAVAEAPAAEAAEAAEATTDEGPAAEPVTVDPRAPQVPEPAPELEPEPERPDAAPPMQLLPSVRLGTAAQPMLFVGLGGTGALIGAELERRLRAELCGPDGTALTGNSGRLPYQLPDFLQFVYADFSEAEVAQLPHLSEKDGLRRQAYARTARATPDLLPSGYDSSPDVTRMLRAEFGEEVAGWLPPPQNEPKVRPLHMGAGQLPTVARAALFGALRNGPTPVTDPLRQAVDAIGRSGVELEELGGGPMRGCDVFVAFSIVGGTGAGIFLDYLHLIGQVFRDRAFSEVRIHPLVVMPSAFPSSLGGSWEAELNAGGALLDLFRLVDEQNAIAVSTDFSADVPDRWRIGYPHARPVRLLPGVVSTAFLFNRTAGMRADDLRGSVASYVMSLVGGGPDRSNGDYPTFADEFANRGVLRSMRADTGIGRRGASTVLTASLTTPLDELADLAAARLLAEAVPRLLDRTVPYPAEVESLFANSGVGWLWFRPTVEMPASPTARGGPRTEKALHDRIDTMQRRLGNLEQYVTDEIRRVVEVFAPRDAVEQLVQEGEVGILALSGLVHSFFAALESSWREPLRPDGVTFQPPPVPHFDSRFFGLPRPRWSDGEVFAAVEKQNRWYQWRADVTRYQAWKALEPRLRPAVNELRAEIGQLTSAFRTAAEENQVTAQSARWRELYTDRTGVSYVLPQQITPFLADLTQRLAESEGLDPNSAEDAVLLKLVNASQWTAALAAGRRDPQTAVAVIKDILSKRIRAVLTEGARPPIPRLATLLSAAAGDSASAEQVGAEAVQMVHDKVAALLPPAFIPEGSGSIKVLVTYPGPQSAAVEDYLLRSLALSRRGWLAVQMQSGGRDALTVVLLRTEMGLDEVPEARKVLATWARSKNDPRPGDLLPWRQRLGYQDDWLASTKQDRVHILHRLLCAMWNGRIDFQGDVESPSKVRIRLDDQTGPHVPGITLRLDDYANYASSWARLLHAYERWALLDDGATTGYYGRELMNVLPNGLATADAQPSPLYRKFVDEIAPYQLGLLEGHTDRNPRGWAEWVRPLRQFWAKTLPAALDLPFDRPDAIAPTLRALYERSAR